MQFLRILGHIHTRIGLFVHLTKHCLPLKLEPFNKNSSLIADFCFVKMVVLAQQAGGTTPVQVKAVGGSLILTSGTLRVTVVVAAERAAIA